MRRFFAPRSICILGASSDPNRIGGRPIRYLREAGFSGRVYPVNPNRQEVQGHRGYPSVAALPERPDVAVVALPRHLVVSAVSECLEAGIPRTVLFSSGFAEADEEGRRLQEELRACLAGRDARLLGPNCNGIMDVVAGAYLSFTPLLDRGRPRQGGLAVVTQSAAVGTYILDQARARGIGLRYWVHTGNEMDVTLEEVLEFLVSDPDVSSIALAFEVLRAPRRLVRALDRARERDITIAALQVATSDVGRLAAQSHTGALMAYRSEIVSGLLRQAGACAVSSMRELLDAVQAAGVARLSGGGRAAVLTPSGGIGIMLADALSEAGFRLPRLSEQLQEQLRVAAPFCHTGNPVDTTAQVVNEPAIFRQVLAVLADSGEVDLLAIFLPCASLSDSLTLQLLDVARSRGSAQVAVALVAVGSMDSETMAALGDAGVPVFAEPRDLGNGLRAVTRRPRSPARAPMLLASATPAEAAVDLHSLACKGIVDEWHSKEVLRRYGVRTVPDAVVRSPAEASRAAERLGYPVALKVSVPGLAHKARSGGVRLGLRSPDEVERAAGELLELARQLAGERRAAGAEVSLLVEPMASGTELFLGFDDDRDFGPVVLCGLGGTQVEQQAQIAYRRLPLSSEDVRQMLEEVPALRWAIRGADGDRVVREIEAILSALGALWEQSGRCVASVDLNPVMIDERGACTVVDALIELT